MAVVFNATLQALSSLESSCLYFAVSTVCADRTLEMRTKFWTGGEKNSNIAFALTFQTGPSVCIIKTH